MNEFASVYNLFFNPGEVCEIRAFGLNGKGAWDGFAKGTGVVFGYFDNPNSFANAATALEKTNAHGIYFTLNPVLPDFLGRAVNRLKAAGTKDKTTSDDNTQCLRWLPVDFDPIRAAGGSDLNSNAEEFKSAWELRNAVHEGLRSAFQAKDGIPAISGNGAHLLFRLPDLKPVPENVMLIRNALLGLKETFPSEAVSIDLKVFNPARIWKLYGTTARKSDHTEQRPQRKSYVQFSGDFPTLSIIPVNSVHFLRQLAEMAPKEKEKEPEKPKPKPASASSGSDSPDDIGPINVSEYLNAHGYSHRVVQDGEYTKFFLDSGCLFNPDHKGKDSYLYQRSSGVVGYYCSHNSCSGREWPDARQIISGSESLAQYCANYNPNWEPPEKKGKKEALKKRKQAQDNPEKSFFYINEKGRLCLNTAKMATWLKDQISPVYYTQKQIWKYRDSGVWEHIDPDEVRQLIRQELGDEATPTRTEQVLGNFCHDVWISEEEILSKQNPLLLNLKNGMYSLEEHRLLPHNPEYHSRNQIPCNYNENAYPENWMKFLDSTFSDTPPVGAQKIDTLQQFFGYCLYPKILFPAAMFAIGDGRNGKGVAEHALISMLGKKNVCHISLKRMEERFGMGELKDKLLNSVSETEAGLLDVSNFKKASAGDEVQADRKFAGDISFTPIAKHYISMNAFPQSKEKTESFYRRIIVLEFSQKFEGENRDVFLKDKIEKEIDGILNWSLAGLKEVLKNKEIRIGEVGENAKERYKVSNNNLALFVLEACVLSPEISINPPELFRAYLAWAAESNVRNTLGKNKFYEELLLSYPGKVQRKNDGKIGGRLFAGIGLTASAQDLLYQWQQRKEKEDVRK